MDELFDPVAYINTPRWQQVSLGLDRTRLMMQKLGNPQESLKFVHVAGTNGKGSTCAYIATVLQEAGYVTGLFTSPYIEVFEERIRVNGQNIPREALTEITLQVRAAAREVEAELGEHPTEFELMTAVALCYYAQCACDIVVLEVGLGGRLDSTNIIQASEVCVIARLGLDHTGLLGTTLAQIAGEKAGIIKPGASVVCYPQEPEAQAVIEEAAAAVGAACVAPDFDQLDLGTTQVLGSDEQMYIVRVFEYKGRRYHTSLLGSYQPCNAAVALEVLFALQARGWNISQEAIDLGIEKTLWPGRFEVYPRKAGEPWVVVDGGHNPQGVEALVETLGNVFPDKKPVVVLSVLADKDHRAMTTTLASVTKAFVAVEPPNMRALHTAELAAELREVCAACGRGDVVVQEAVDFNDAFARARALAGEDDVIAFSGSLYSVALEKAAINASQRAI